MATRHLPGVGRFATVRRAALPLLLSGLAFAALPACPVFAQPAPGTRAQAADPYAAFVTEASRRFGIPERWIRAVRRVESADDPLAVSPKGAMGLMQIMPSTWRELRLRYGFGDNPVDPRTNILAGTAYLAELHDRYGSPGFLAAYNAGPGRYEEYLAGRPLPAETRAYVAILAPFVGGGELAPAMPENTIVAAVDPNAWRNAPLFVTPSAVTAGSVRSPEPAPPDDGSIATSPRHTRPDAPQSGDLFIARAGEGDRP